MNENQEQQWIEGNRAAWRSMLQRSLVELGFPADHREEALFLELETARAALLSLIGDLSDGVVPDYSPRMHLADLVRQVEKRVL